ncbi:MAG: dihydroorotase [Tissierellales bacterium]|nr:dihydroorotase [Tissierellales bacterium]
MQMLIKNIRLVDEGKDFFTDVLIINDKIVQLKESIELEDEEVIINGENLVLMPSFIDLHAHFRDPGYTYKEDILTGSRAAVRGGFTYVNLIANTNPICSNEKIVSYVLEKARNIGLIDVNQTLSITENFDGVTLSHLDNISNAIKVISDDGKGIKSTRVMYEALIKAKEKGLVVLVHAEDEEISKIDYRLAENLETVRDIYLNKKIGAKLHLTHVSTKEAIEDIERAKKDNDNVTCDVTPHHIALWDNDYRVNPPIREKEDVDRLIKAIRDGVIDAIATDHAPHSVEDKQKNAPGMVGLETAFKVAYTTLVKPNHIDLKRLSSLLTYGPARILGLEYGRLENGSKANFVIVDPEKESTVDSNKFHSKSKNTAFEGMKFSGEVLMTVKDGDIKYIDEDFKKERFCDN